MTALKELAEAVQGWGNCTEAWLDTSEDDAAAVVGHIDEDGNAYPVAYIDCEQYYAEHDSLKLAKFYAAANPSAVLALLDDTASLRQQLAEANRKIEFEQLCASELEQQLAEARRTAEYWKAEHLAGNEQLAEQAEAIDLQLHTNRRIAKLEQQLAAALAACKQKDRALEKVHLKVHFGFTSQEWEFVCKALAIKPDDSALKTWLGEPVVWMQSDHLSKFIYHACGSQAGLVRCSDHQLMSDFKPLYAPKGVE